MIPLCVTMVVPIVILKTDQNITLQAAEVPLSKAQRPKQLHPSSVCETFLRQKQATFPEPEYCANHVLVR